MKHSILKLIVILSLLSLVTSCLIESGIRSAQNSISTRQFSVSDSFAKPITAKELHLDTGKLTNIAVSVEGQILATGDQFTHLLLSDDSGRILVQLTKLPNIEEFFRRFKPSRIKVIGVLERGKKGLPFLMADTVKQVGI